MRGFLSFVFVVPALVLMVTGTVLGWIGWHSAERLMDDAVGKLADWATPR